MVPMFYQLILRTYVADHIPTMLPILYKCFNLNLLTIAHVLVMNIFITFWLQISSIRTNHSIYYTIVSVFFLYIQTQYAEGIAQSVIDTITLCE